MRSNAEVVINQVVDTIEHLRVSAGPLDDEGWLSCRELVDEPESLRRIIRSVGEARQPGRDDMTMSIFAQGYAYRVASVAIGAWLLEGVALDVRPENMAITLKEGRPRAVRFAQYAIVEDKPDLAALHEVMTDSHLSPMVHNARRAMRIGERLLWANIGAACAASFGAFMVPLPQRHAHIRDAVLAFFAAARPELAQSGRVVPLGPVWAWERRSCCLWYKAEGGFKCQDCSLWSNEERQERYARVLAEVES
jgi:siderophore-iron reductase FhuF